MELSNRVWRILGMVNFGLDIFILFFLIAVKWIEIPSFLQIFGRAHPMVLHFPVVFIFLLPIIPWVLSSLSLSKQDTRQFMGHYIILAHFLCALTVLFGLILSVEGGYTGEDVNYHKWGGVFLLFALMILENIWYYPVLERKRIRMFLFIPMIALIITSHIGAGITHGRDFLTEPIFKKTLEQVPLEQAIVFRDVIQPILNRRCVNCHNSNKSKGELILKDSSSILKGGENGEVIVLENRMRSPIIQRLLLDIDHDDHMPPKGKPQLSQTEIGLLSEWIKKDDLFGLHFSALDPNDTLAILIEENYETHTQPIYTMDPADEDDIASLNNDYRLLVPVAQESPALYARFLSPSHFKSDQLKELDKIHEQIVDLNVGHMSISDEDLSVLENFENLQVLNLNGNQITNKGLLSLYNLKDLQKLYLAETAVTDVGIQELLKTSSIKKIYLWDTGVDSIGLETLRRMFPMTEIIGESNPFGDESIALNGPQVKPENPFFHSSVVVTVSHPIPGVNIRYTMDGSDPDSVSSPLYEEPLEVHQNMEFRFKAYKEGWLSSPVRSRSYFDSRYTPDSTWFISAPIERYAGVGPKTLVNLEVGEVPHEDKSYIGYRQKEGVIGFSFKEPVELTDIIISGLIKTGTYIFPPYRIIVEIEDDGGKWVKAGDAVPDQPEYEIGFEKYFIKVPLDEKRKVSEMKVTIAPLPKLPSWHRAKGDKGWVFVDEVLFQ